MSQHCAICGKHVPPDNDHVYITAKRKRMRDRDGTDEYAFHTRCWDRLSDGWMEPA